MREGGALREKTRRAGAIRAEVVATDAAALPRTEREVRAGSGGARVRAVAGDAMHG